MYNGVYRLNPEQKKAVFLRPASINQTGLTIRSTITHQGVTYKVTQIAKGACRDYKKLKKVTIGKYVTLIGQNAFRGCIALKTVSGGKGVVTVQADAFRGCKALTGISLYSKVRTIGARAFYGCKKMKKLELLTKRIKASGVGARAFMNGYKKIVVICPDGLEDNYKSIFLARGMSSMAVFV